MNLNSGSGLKNRVRVGPNIFGSLTTNGIFRNADVF